MKNDKAKTAEPANLLEEEEEYPAPLSYHIDKLVIIAKDTAIINITNLMSGKPKDGPP